MYEAVQGDKSPIPQAVDLFAGKPQQEVVLAALEDTRETLSKRYGNNVSNWKTPAMALTFRQIISLVYRRPQRKKRVIRRSIKTVEQKTI